MLDSTMKRDPRAEKKDRAELSGGTEQSQERDEASARRLRVLVLGVLIMAGRRAALLRRRRGPAAGAGAGCASAGA